MVDLGRSQYIAPQKTRVLGSSTEPHSKPELKKQICLGMNNHRMWHLTIQASGFLICSSVKGISRTSRKLNIWAAFSIEMLGRWGLSFLIYNPWVEILWITTPFLVGWCQCCRRLKQYDVSKKRLKIICWEKRGDNPKRESKISGSQRCSWWIFVRKSPSPECKDRSAFKVLSDWFIPISRPQLYNMQQYG